MADKFLLLFYYRAFSGRWQRGGNASNICSVLRQLGAKCEFIGSLSNAKAFSFLTEDCRDRGILIDHCVYHSTSIAPFSSVILNEANGSRTIVHSNPNMPILTADDFYKIPYERYRWIHFEVSTIEYEINYYREASTSISIQWRGSFRKLITCWRFIGFLFYGIYWSFEWDGQNFMWLKTKKLLS